MHSHGEPADLILETPQGSQGALEHLCGGVLLSEMAAITSDPKGSLRSLSTAQNCPPVVIQIHCWAVTHRVVSGTDQGTTHRGKSECLPCSHLCSPREAGGCPHLLCVPLSSIRPPCLAAKPRASLLETSSPPAGLLEPGSPPEQDLQGPKSTLPAETPGSPLDTWRRRLVAICPPASIRH